MATSPEDKLIEIYRKAYIDLVKRIEAKEARGNVTAFERSLLADVTEILQGLDSKMKRWVETELPKVYHGSADATYQAFIDAGADVPPLSASFGKVHRSAIKAIADNMVGNLTEAHQFVGRQVMDEWRKVSLYAITGKIATGRTWKDAKKELVRSIGDHGLGAFKDSRGRVWRLDSYAEMVVRTTTREATNSGLMNQLQNMDKDLVQITRHMVTCSICAPYAGRVYSISGSTPGYPALRSVPGFAQGYNTIHGNCRHVLMPYIPELDGDADGTRENSNRPFKDERTKSQIAAYDKAQEKKRKQRETRKQWESYRAWLPNEAPKTLAGFVRMKGSSSERYQELQKLYREARQQAKDPAYTEIKRLLNGASLNSREDLARHLLDQSGLNHIPVSVERMQDRGACAVPVENGQVSVKGLFLQSGDGRPERYRIKTVFHEVTHARINGAVIESDGIPKYFSSQWLDIEEPVAECTAHYLLSKAGIMGEIAPAYALKLVRILPKLKQLDEYKECSTLVDFGRVMSSYRYGTVPEGQWTSLLSRLEATRFDLADYAESYREYIFSNLDSITDAIYDNQGTTNSAVRDAIRSRIVDAWERKAVDDPAFADSLIVAMNRTGVR